MSALTQARNTTKLAPGEVVLTSLDLLQKGSTVINEGALVVIAGGYAKPGAAGLGLVAAGRASMPNGQPSDSTGLADGAVHLRVEQGVFAYAMGSGGDVIAQANVGLPCFVIDDQTVGLTDGGGTRSVAGMIVGIKSTTEVWVSIGLQLADLTPFAVGFDPEEIAASGALSIVVRTSRLTISGTKAYTLADGTRSGQRKTLFVVSVASTPSGVVTPAHASGFTTITFGAGTGNSSVELEWDSSLGTPAWKVVGVTTTAGGTLTIA
jgi:hypothetical protein